MCDKKKCEKFTTLCCIIAKERLYLRRENRNKHQRYEKVLFFDCFGRAHVRDRSRCRGVRETRGGRCPRPRYGQTRCGGGLRHGGGHVGRRAGGRCDERRERPFYDEAVARRLQGGGGFRGIRERGARDKRGRRRGRYGRHRVRGVVYRDRRGGGVGADDTSRGRPFRGRRGQLGGRDRQGRRRSAAAVARGVGRRRQDRGERRERHQGVYQRPRSASLGRGVGAVRPQSARRRYLEDRGDPADGRRPRRRFVGRSDKDNAQTSPRQRHDGFGEDVHAA